MTATITTRDHVGIARQLLNRKDFKTHGALSGKAGTPGPNGEFWTPGRLPNDWYDTFQARKHAIDYVVYSYHTPIAWHDAGNGWIVPDVRYSVTTCKHQSKVRVAISRYFDYTE